MDNALLNERGEDCISFSIISISIFRRRPCFHLSCIFSYFFSYVILASEKEFEKVRWYAMMTGCCFCALRKQCQNGGVE